MTQQTPHEHDKAAWDKLFEETSDVLDSVAQEVLEDSAETLEHPSSDEDEAHWS